MTVHMRTACELWGHMMVAEHGICMTAYMRTACELSGHMMVTEQVEDTGDLLHPDRGTESEIHADMCAK